MNCPKCQSGENVKAGFTAGKQRYKCKDKECGCHFTRSTPKGEPLEKKRQAVHLYLEGVGFRAIGRLLGVSHVSVQDWVAQAAEKLENLVPLYPARVELLELDEMHHYVGKKVMKSGYGLLLPIGDANCWPSRLAIVEQKLPLTSGLK